MGLIVNNSVISESACNGSDWTRYSSYANPLSYSFGRDATILRLTLLIDTDIRKDSRLKIVDVCSIASEEDGLRRGRLGRIWIRCRFE